jgi:hypothetical protein
MTGPDEERPRWWEAPDLIRLYRINDNPSGVAFFPVIRLNDWRNNPWPDRPHP